MLQCSQFGRIHSEFGVLLSQINQPDANYTLSIANRLYATKAMAFHQVSPPRRWSTAFSASSDFYSLKHVTSEKSYMVCVFKD